MKLVRQHAAPRLLWDLPIQHSARASRPLSPRIATVLAPVAPRRQSELIHRCSARRRIGALLVPNPLASKASNCRWSVRGREAERGSLSAGTQVPPCPFLAEASHPAVVHPA